jgi:hypothetical protein
MLAMQHKTRPLPRHGSLLVPLLVIVLLLAVRCVAVFRLETDSDEAQHLHLIYGWLGGELPYRDRFDNHTPLLYLIFLPLAALAGETPHIVLLARLAEFPISLGILGLIYLIGRRLADREVALWTLAATLAWGDWSLKSVEFRPDVLWSFCWFVVIWILARPHEPPGPRRGVLIGVFLGTALCASIKTTFLPPALILGWALAWLLCADLRRTMSAGQAIRCLIGAGAGFPIVPLILFGWFVSNGTTLETLKFCLFEANRANLEAGRVLASLGLAALVLWLGWKMTHRGIAGVSVAIFLSVAIYTVALVGFSPELRKQSLLPVYPLFILFAWLWWADFLRRHRRGTFAKVGLAVCGIGFIHLSAEGRLWEDGLKDQRELLKDTLKLTKPGDFLMDRKGETIFRRRPVYLVYQQATVRAIEEGRIADPDPALLTKTGTAVVIGDSMGLTDQMKKFVGKNYLPAGDGRLRVAGRSLLFYEENGGLAARAPIYVPGDYVVLRGGKVLRETPVREAGWHDVDLGGAPGPATLFWKAAWDLGFRPIEKVK